MKKSFDNTGPAKHQGPSIDQSSWGDNWKKKLMLDARSSKHEINVLWKSSKCSTTNAMQGSTQLKHTNTTSDQPCVVNKIEDKQKLRQLHSVYTENASTNFNSKYKTIVSLDRFLTLMIHMSQINEQLYWTKHKKQREMFNINIWNSNLTQEENYKAIAFLRRPFSACSQLTRETNLSSRWNTVPPKQRRNPPIFIFIFDQVNGFINHKAN